MSLPDGLHFLLTLESSKSSECTIESLTSLKTARLGNVANVVELQNKTQNKKVESNLAAYLVKKS